MKRIFFVEDDPGLMKGLVFALEKQGYEVVCARTLHEAEKCWENGTFDLVILDVSLPDGTGFALCEEIRAQSKVPIIFLTAADEETDIIMGLDMGGDDYITKPFKPLLLAAKVNALLRRVRFEQDAQATPETADLCCGNLRYAHRERVFRADGRALSLTPTERAISLVLSGRLKLASISLIARVTIRLRVPNS